MTMGTSWAYNPNEGNWKSPGILVRNLVDVVSGGGNYLLNIGPTALGSFPSEAIERLQHIGAWMQSNYEAIYGSQYTPLRDLPWGAATRVGDRLYLHVFDWPESNSLLVNPFPGKIKAAHQMDGVPLAYHQEGNSLEINLPSKPPDLDVAVFQVQIDSSEPGWNDYSAPAVTATDPKDYIKSSAIASFIINAIANGLIAYFSLRSSGPIQFVDAAVDVLITVLIISFLTSWIVVGSARGEFRKGNLAKTAPVRRAVKFPQRPVLRALLITLLVVVFFGGVVIDGLLYVFFPVELSNWAYIVIKILYTGLTGALASAFAIQTVVQDEGREGE